MCSQTTMAGKKLAYIPILYQIAVTSPPPPPTGPAWVEGEHGTAAAVASALVPTAEYCCLSLQDLRQQLVITVSADAGICGMEATPYSA